MSETITVHNVDTLELREQIEYIIFLNDPELEGILNMLEIMLDTADGVS